MRDELEKRVVIFIAKRENKTMSIRERKNKTYSSEIGSSLLFKFLSFILFKGFIFLVTKFWWSIRKMAMV